VHTLVQIKSNEYNEVHNKELITFCITCWLYKKKCM